MNGADLRLAAREFAKDIMRSMPIPQADAPYLEAVIVEAALFEEPMKDLSIGLNGVGTNYSITIKGYQNLIPLVRWVNTFLGQGRHQMLSHVTDTFCQTNDKSVIMVLLMDKVEFRRATLDSSAAAVKKIKKRVD